MVSGNVLAHILMALTVWLQGDPNDSTPFSLKFSQWRLDATVRELNEKARQRVEGELKTAQDELARTREVLKRYEAKEDPTKEDLILIKVIKPQEQHLQRRVMALETDFQRLSAQLKSKR